MLGLARVAVADPIETRMAGQDLLSVAYETIKTVVEAKGDVRTLEIPAKAMSRWMRQFPSQFPKGTEQGQGTKVLGTIWSDPAGFKKAADVFVAATDRLSQFAKAGNAAETAAQLRVVTAACGECHRQFRTR